MQALSINSVKKTLCILLAVIMAFGFMMPALQNNSTNLLASFLGIKEAYAAEADVDTWNTSGTCQWGIDPDGCLWIRPANGVSGTLGFWSAPSTPPWSSQKSSVLSVVVKDGVSATTCESMFADMSNVTTIDLSGLNASSVENMYGMFSRCSSLTQITFGNLDTSATTNMAGMFQFCTSLTSLDIHQFDTSNVTNMNYMFQGNTSLTSLNVSGLNNESLTSMISMLSGCSNLMDLNMRGFRAENVENMNSAFTNCAALSTLDLSSLNTSALTSASNLFKDCSSLVSLDISHLNTENITGYSLMKMFDGNPILQLVKLGNTFTFSGNGATIKAILPTPTGSDYTGKWVLLNDSEGESAMTPTEMSDAGHVTPGTWVWQRVDGTFDEYLPAPAVDPNTTEFNAVLLMNADASVPNVTISYSIAAGTGIAAVPGTTHEVISPTAANGVTGTPTISPVTFGPSDATTTSATGVTVGANQKVAIKPVEIDFNNVTFAQPGIFRYIISEPSSGFGLTYDTQLGDTVNGVRYQRVLDIYVVRDANDDYVIGGFVMHEVANAPAEGASSVADKSSGVVNEYATAGITLECLVDGNQSSIDKYFKYDITMTNPNGTAFTVAADWSNASGALNPVANHATSYTNATITAANTVSWTSSANGTLTKSIYLKNGQKIAIDGMPVGTVYSIEVTEEDYGPDWNIKVGGTAYDAPEGNDPLDATGNQTLAAAVQDVQFTLSREGVVPTGVALSILPGVIIMAAAAVAVLMIRKKKASDET